MIQSFKIVSWSFVAVLHRSFLPTKWHRFYFVFFSNGVLQNIADFFGISFFGLVKPSNIDWMSEYDVTRFHTSQRPYDYI